MKLFQIMPCRLQGYQATLDGYLKTDKFLISFNDVCNGGSEILIPSGISDHLGSFLYIPYFAYKFNAGFCPVPFDLIILHLKPMAVSFFDKNLIIPLSSVFTVGNLISS